MCSVNQLRINKGRKIKLREQAGCALSLSLQKIQHNKLCFYCCNSSAFPPRLYLTLTTLTTHTHTDAGTHTNTSRVRDSGRHSYLYTLAAHNESDFLCSQWLSGADSLSALCVSTGGFEALPWLDSRGHALTDVFTLAHTLTYAHIAPTSLQGWLQQ